MNNVGIRSREWIQYEYIERYEYNYILIEIEIEFDIDIDIDTK